jgi:hypothetical protein
MSVSLHLFRLGRNSEGCQRRVQDHRLRSSRQNLTRVVVTIGDSYYVPLHLISNVTRYKLVGRLMRLLGRSPQDRRYALARRSFPRPKPPAVPGRRTCRL